MKLLSENSKHDTNVPPIGWRKLGLPKNIGFMKPVREIPLSKSSLRAYEMAKNALLKKGINLIEVDIQNIFKDLLVACVAAFLKNESFEQILKGEINLKEKLFNAFDGFVMAYKVPRILLKHL